MEDVAPIRDESLDLTPLVADREPQDDDTNVGMTILPIRQGLKWEKGCFSKTIQHMPPLTYPWSPRWSLKKRNQHEKTTKKQAKNGKHQLDPYRSQVHERLATSPDAELPGTSAAKGAELDKLQRARFKLQTDEVKLERAKLQLERAKLQLEISKLQLEREKIQHDGAETMRASAEQAHTI